MISPRSIGPSRHFKRPFTKTIGSHSEDLITSPSALFTHHPISSFSRTISAAALLYHPIRECLSAIPAMRTSRSKLGLRVRAQEHCRYHTDGTAPTDLLICKSMAAPHFTFSLPISTPPALPLTRPFTPFPWFSFTVFLSFLFFIVRLVKDWMESC